MDSDEIYFAIRIQIDVRVNTLAQNCNVSLPFLKYFVNVELIDNKGIEFSPSASLLSWVSLVGQISLENSSLLCCIVHTPPQGTCGLTKGYFTYELSWI